MFDLFADPDDHLFGSTSLHEACSRHDGRKEADTILSSMGEAEKRAAVAAVDLEGSTPLHCACQVGDWNLVEMLLCHADLALLSARDVREKTPLHIACDFGHLSCARAIAEAWGRKAGVLGGGERGPCELIPALSMPAAVAVAAGTIGREGLLQLILDLPTAQTVERWALGSPDEAAWGPQQGQAPPAWMNKNPTPLHAAVFAQNQGAIRVLAAKPEISKRMVLPSGRESGQRSPFWVAARCEYVE